MIPLNYSINYAAELTQSPRAVYRQISSRCLSTLSLPIELLAVAENIIKLPFQTTACAIKFPIRLLSAVTQSKTLRECADALTSLKELLQTALKVVGYAAGFFFTASIGLISPYYNFKIHCALRLTTDRAAEKQFLLEEEKKRQEIAAYEAILAAYLHEVILAIQQQSQLASTDNKAANANGASETPVVIAVETSSPEISTLPVPQSTQSPEPAPTPETTQHPIAEVAPIQEINLPKPEITETAGTETEEIPAISAESETQDQSPKVIPLSDSPIEDPAILNHSNQAITLEA
jgi:hypothetical protein